MTLTTGNTAKLYCLNWIEQQVQTNNGQLSILDLGCGTANNFVRLLATYPDVRYTGIEPSEAACQQAKQNLKDRNATIIHDNAYRVWNRLVKTPVDIVVSFSVLEHVYQRLRYLQSIADCLKPGGYALINYDSGHFRAPATPKERLKNIIGPLLALVGQERYYQRFVKEADFRQMVAALGLTIVDEKFFNTHLKGIHKHLPAELAEAHMTRWLAYELWLNDTGIQYTDRKASTWFTRNFILHKPV